MGFADLKARLGSPEGKLRMYGPNTGSIALDRRAGRMLVMSQVPLPGEQSAIRGFRWQYDHIARLVYNGIVDAEFDCVRLVSTNAGQVDDLLLDSHSRRDAYQYKSGMSNATVSFNELLRPKRTAKGLATDSLWRALATAWKLMEDEDARPLYVHLATTAVTSTSDHVTDGQTTSASPDHFRAFLARAMERIGDVDVEIMAEWLLPFERMQLESGLSRTAFRRFLQHVRLDFGLGEALAYDSGTRESDIRELSNALYRKVSLSSGPVTLNRDEVLLLMGWKDRKSFRSIHDFPVNPASYSPLTGAIDLLHETLDRIDSGYVAVTGPPGSGKSTLLTQTLAGLPDRVVRYYAFVPGSGGGRNRLSADWFLHDLSTMLRNAGLDTRQKQLTATTVQDLRQTVLEQLDAASNEYTSAQRRTIIVVDGLDHVLRDYSGNDGLTNELLSPANIPPGVIFLVGSRDLSPLPSQARQSVEDRSTEVNLEHQRLSRGAILQVCRSVDSTSILPVAVHELVADRCAGHPLSLAYLLNRLEDYQGDDPLTFVRSMAEYDGDIAMQYREAWDQLDLSSGVENVLRVCSRLRVGFDLNWVATWASPDAIRIFRTHLRFLFRVEEKRWRFFHDSFRQFARERTSIGDDRAPDPQIDRQAHAEVAGICEQTDVRYINSQALFHWSQAGELNEVLRIGTQAHFRQQFIELRASSDLADDARLVLRAAASQGDFPALLRGLLILSEIQDKASELEEIDVCRALFMSGQIDSAVAYVGNEQSLNVPLSQAYELAADLARIGNSSGLRVFEWIHHFGLQQPGQSHRSTTDSDVGSAWARCAAHFLPLDMALTKMRDVLDLRIGDSEWTFDRTYHRFSGLITSFIKERYFVAPSDLLEIDTALAEEIEALSSKGLDSPRVQKLTALINDLRYKALSTHIATAGNFDARAERFKHLDTTLRGVRVYKTTLLGIASLEAEFASVEKAHATLAKTGFDAALSLETLGSNGDEDAIANRFSYWKLRHELEIGLRRRSGQLGDGPIESIAPNLSTPAGNGIIASASVHEFDDAIAIVARIDKLVRSLGLISALVATGSELLEEDVWGCLGSAISLFPPFDRHGRSWSSLAGLRAHREKIHLLVFRVLESVSTSLLARYQTALGRRFDSQPEEWHTSLRLSLGVGLRQVSMSPPWLAGTIEQFEREAPTQGVNAALTDLGRLVETHAKLGDQNEAARVLVKLFKTTFGLGSRNDYQLHEWVQWLGQSSRSSGMSGLRESAIWLAKILTAAELLTDQTIGAEKLPAVIAQTSPTVALETFEYLVAHGGARHTDTMANLLTALVETGELTQDSLSVVADLAGEIVAGAGNTAHPQLSQALRAAAQPSTLQRFATTISTSALGTTRSQWVNALFSDTTSLPSDDGDDEDYNALKLADGTSLLRREVLDVATDLPALTAVLIREAANGTQFDWVKVLEINFPQPDVAGIEKVFSGSRYFGKVLVWLAEKQIGLANRPAAIRLARQATESVPLDTWSEYRDGTRRRAIRILVESGDMPARTAALDFVRFIEEDRWYSSMLHTDLKLVFDAITPETSPIVLWREIREYLEGLSANLGLPNEVEPHTPMVKWWLPNDTGASRSSVTLGPNEAVAELAAIHLSHPSWPVREGVARVIVAALERGSLLMLDAMERLVANDSTDDVLETVASCMSASALRTGTDNLASGVRKRVAEHPNMIIRRLMPPALELSELRIARPLPQSFRLVLPDLENDSSLGHFGARALSLFPFEEQYKVLADLTGLDIASIVGVASRYSDAALRQLPSQDQISGALSGAAMNLASSPMAVLASRSAFGRVLGDLVDAGLLEELPDLEERLLRTDDVQLVGRQRVARPAEIPTSPEAGHDQTIGRWLDEIEERLEKYIQASRSSSRQLVGAVCNLTVLNWGYLEEDFRCAIVLRDSPATAEPMINGRLSDLSWDGLTSARYDMDSLLIENEGRQLLDRRADWIAVHPVLARSLGWVYDSKRIGGWLSLEGDVAAETLDWNDGTWGRSGPTFDDVTSEGFATTLSLDALSAVKSFVGPLDLVFNLARSDRKRSVEPVFATRRVQL
jgi:hypothetical protein